MSNRKSIVGLQGLRAISALLVLLQHSIFFTYIAKHTVYPSYNFGNKAIFLFFIISGYVITLCLSEGKAFMLNRIIRIYPPFWAVIILSGLIFSFLGKQWFITFSSMILIPDTIGNNSYHIPYYTLVYEMFFYALIYIFILLDLPPRKIVYVLLGWAGLIILASQDNLVGPINIAFPGKLILFSPLYLLSIAGALYGLILQDKLNNNIILIPMILLSGITFFAVEYMMVSTYYLYILGWCLIHVTILELSKRLKSIPLWLKKLGDYSYGFYLIHLMIINVAVYVLIEYLPNQSFLTSFVFIIFTSFIGGIMFGALEHYLYRNKFKIWLNKIRTLRLNVQENLMKLE